MDGNGSSSIFQLSVPPTSHPTCHNVTCSMFILGIKSSKLYQSSIDSWIPVVVFKRLQLQAGKTCDDDKADKIVFQPAKRAGAIVAALGAKWSNMLPMALRGLSRVELSCGNAHAIGNWFEWIGLIMIGSYWILPQSSLAASVTQKSNKNFPSPI